MIAFPDVSRLLAPEQIVLSDGQTVDLFRSASTDLVKLDFVFEAGSYYQPQLLTAIATAKLLCVSTVGMDAQRLSEFMDSRGVVVDSTSNVFTSCLTVYTHRRYAEEVVEVVGKMLHEPAFEENDFEVWCAAKRQEVAVQQRRTSVVARRLWYEGLFGKEHPLGRSAKTEDVDRLTVDVVREYFSSRYLDEMCRVVVSGCVDDKLLSAIEKMFSRGGRRPLSLMPRSSLLVPCNPPTESMREEVDGSQQTSIRIGRVLPALEGMPIEESARLAVCTTMLGGWFGSRLMSNLREDKGYTYGVSAHIQPYRGCRVFFIASDVAPNSASNAEREVLDELQNLADNLPSAEELETVKSIMAGDAMRMLDGVFEHADRYCDLMESGAVDLYDARFAQVLKGLTPEHIAASANQWLRPEQMLCCQAGR